MDTKQSEESKVSPNAGNAPTTHEFNRLFSAQRADALLMLDYARQKGLNLSEHLVLDLVADAELIERDISGAQYAKFIDALGQITKLIAPTTPDSIRFSTKTDDKGRSIIRSLVIKYATFGYCIFALLFALQGYWFLLNGIVDSINKTFISLVPYGELENAMTDKLSAKLHHPPNDDELRDALAPYYDQIGNDIMSGAIKADIAVNGSFTKEKKYISDADRGYLRLTLASDLAALSRFVGIFSQAFIDQRVKPGDKNLYYTWTVEHNDIRNIQAAHMVLDMLNKYILPILYGLLGASLYLVRRLNGEIKSVSFQESSRAELDTRFFVGGVSGLVIAWFVAPESSSTTLLSSSSSIVSNLSPLALSFIAGYAIELLFSIIDKIVTAFTEKEAK